MKRFQGLINRTKSLSTHGPRSQTAPKNFDNAPADSPEANAGRAVRLFCESGSASNGGEEVLHLPVIVESAESSPSAAASAAYQIRKFLGKEYQNKPHVQYNAIMLVRILSDNPGPTFTRNFDKGFVGAVKETLRGCKDASTQQILRETLDSLEAEKQYDEGLQGLLVMWRKEKGQSASLGQRSSVRHSQTPRDFSAWQQPGQEQQFGGGGGQRRSGRTTLPAPAELASRVEEARNTAKILLQLVQSTRTEDVLNHELIREFSERCQGAQRSMQGYINCDNPAPDHDTMQTLIETNEQLSLALSRHQRAVLAARRALGTAESPAQATTTENGYGAFAPPPATGAQNGNGVYNQTGAFGAQPQQAPANGFGASVVGQTQENRSSYEGYQSPPGPPPGQVSSFDQRPAQPHHQQSWAKPNNPFADPVDSPAPLAIEPTNYGTTAGAFSQQPQHLSQQPPQLPPHQPQTFSIEPEPTFAPSPPRRQNTADLENAYSDSEGRVSPILHRGAPAESTISSPDSPHRPGPGPWHHSEITQSYVGRQSSAVNGITMHGAQSQEEVQEIDGYSRVGRGTTGAGSVRSSEYEVSPVEVRTAQVGRRY